MDHVERILNILVSTQVAGYVAASRYATPAWEVELDAFVYTVALSADDEFLAAGCLNCVVVLYDARTRAKLHVLPQDGAVMQVAFNPKSVDRARVPGNDLAVASNQSHVDVWRLPPADRKTHVSFFARAARRSRARA